MTSILAVQKQIRRAVQKPLYDAAVTAGLVDGAGEPLIQWKGVAFERAGLTKYLSVDIGMGRVIVHEIGKTPMMEGPGYVSVVMRTLIAAGEDANDALALIVDAAYPYASTPTFEGVTVNIDKSEHRGYSEDGPWLIGLVSVGWSIYRRTP